MVAVEHLGCSRPAASFDAADPSLRIEAIRKAAHDRDMTAVPSLISLLDSDDPAVRLLAIRTLEDLTSQTLGYDHAAPPWSRREAVDRWMRWYSQQGATPGPGAARPGP